MARIEQELDRKRREEKWQNRWCCRDQQRACRMAQASAEKLEHTGPDKEKKKWPRWHKESSWQVRRSCLSQKKRNRVVSPEHQIMRGRESRWARAASWREREREREIRTKARRGKGGLHIEGKQLPRRRRKGKQEELLQKK